MPRAVPRLPEPIRARGRAPRAAPPGASARRVAPRAVVARHRAHGLRRLLRRGGEARRPRHAARPPVIVGCGRRGVVSPPAATSPNPRRPLRHADAPGAAPLPRRRGRKTRFPAYVRRLARHPRPDGGVDPRIEPLSSTRPSSTFPAPNASMALLRPSCSPRSSPHGNRARPHRLGRSLSHNKFLAKVASDSTARGFSVIGRAETPAFLAPRPVTMIWGVGEAGREALARAGIRAIGDLLRWDRRDSTPVRLPGRTPLGTRPRRGSVPSADREVKSVSNETRSRGHEATATSRRPPLAPERRCRRGARRATSRPRVTLKLKRAARLAATRRASLPPATQMADRLLPVGPRPPRRTPDSGLRLRRGLSEIGDARGADRRGRPPRPGRLRAPAAERAADAIRARWATAPSSRAGPALTPRPRDRPAPVPIRPFLPA
jgi:DNA polymerase-4